jgi:hypothetical protein
MFNKMIVFEALKKSQAPEFNKESTPADQTALQDSVISLLIHDVFGGEILKTHKGNKWHYYNRIDGERVDFARPKNLRSEKANNFEDIPATPDETSDYIDQADYSTFFMKFIRAFEETIGLDKYHPGFSV